MLIAAKPSTQVAEPSALPATNERDLRARGDEILVTFDRLLVIVPDAERDFRVSPSIELLAENKQDIGSDGFRGSGRDTTVVIGDCVVGGDEAVLRGQDQNSERVGRLTQILPQTWNAGPSYRTSAGKRPASFFFWAEHAITSNLAVGLVTASTEFAVMKLPG